jgi:membrane fusion protein, multidrug efflux system
MTGKYFEDPNMRPQDRGLPKRNRLVRFLTLVVLVLMAASGCSKPPQTAQRPRPVLVAEVGAAREADVSYAGEVRARYEAKIGFRVGGKIVRRAVNVGDQVKQGQVIAELDPTDYRLAAQAVGAQLRAAQSDYEFAVSDLKRYHELLEEKFIAPAEYERRETALSTLKDRVASLKAQHEQMERQTQYTHLTAEFDSLVVALPAEVEQVVAAGQPVAVLARLSELEVVIDVPEASQATVKRNSTANLRFWARPDVVVQGRVREIAQSAQSAARTYAVRVSLPSAASWVRIGMSATASFPQEAGTSEHQVIPLSAVFVPQGDPAERPRVWALNNDGTVSSVPVRLGALVGVSDVQVGGLAEGLVIVTAGASRLHEGQGVSVLAPSAIGGSLVARRAEQSGAKELSLPPQTAQTKSKNPS